MAFNFAIIDPKSTLQLRQMVLRPSASLEECKFPMDLHESCFHVGAFEDSLDKNPICIASFHEDNFPDPLRAPSYRSAYRLRGMATHPNFLRRGLASQLLRCGIDQLKKRGCDLLWFNARTVSFPFYISQGFQFSGEEFDIPGTGTHKVMSKNI